MRSNSILSPYNKTTQRKWKVFFKRSSKNVLFALLLFFSVMAPQYLGEIKLKHTNAFSEDLQREIINQHPRAVKQVKKWAQKFKRKNDIATAYNVWRYMRKNFKYNRDEPNRQQIFLPSAALHHKKFDCKSYATFAAAIFSALGIPNGYRFTAYHSKTTPSHIYNFIRLSNGNTLPVDGCFRIFGKEKIPTFVKNINLKK